MSDESAAEIATAGEIMFSAVSIVAAKGSQTRGVGGELPAIGEYQWGSAVSNQSVPVDAGRQLRARAAQLLVTSVRRQQQYKATVSVSSATGPNGEQVHLVASTVPLDPALRLPGEIFITHSKSKGHAEIQTLDFARQYGYKLNGVNPSRPFCGNCAFWVRGQGAALPDAMVSGGPGKRSTPLNTMTNQDLANRAWKPLYK
jgi:hypothetical protein